MSMKSTCPRRRIGSVRLLKGIRNGMMFYLGQDHAAYAELFKRKGDLSKAKENLSKAIGIYKECGSDGWVEKAEKELKGLSRKK